MDEKKTYHPVESGCKGRTAYTISRIGFQPGGHPARPTRLIGAVISSLKIEPLVSA